ncbi:PH domain-containing protein [Halobium salinum]|uniref:PH domain-containing protein n=1 Tax=Halobium salinum TaxID=1364940 RepID=A0ABD5P7V3_9EURY|nr:PH domain-containing protein [Halobium salinum]
MSPRLSPLSVPYRAARKGGSLLFTLVFALFSGAMAVTNDLGGPLLVLGLVVLLVLALVGYEVAYYRRYEYELTAESLDISSGVFSRRNREIPLRRVQNVDISRNALQRALSIAAVNFETAGGSTTEAAIRFVSFEEAKRLQREVARLKRGEEPGAGEAGEEDVEELFALSADELALVGLLSFDLRGPGILLFLASGSVPVVSGLFADVEGPLLALGGVAVLLLIVLVSWLAGIAVAVANYYGFTLSRADDELRYERGLLRRYDGSIPLDKVQTVTVEDNPLKRRFGYASLAIETAGYGPGTGGDRGSESAVPLASVERVLQLANDVEPFGDPAFERPPKRVRRRYAMRYLIALAAVTAAFFGVEYVLAVGFPWWIPLVLLAVVPVAAHLKWLHRGYWLGADHVVTRNGFWRRQTKVVPYYRIQTVIESRTPFQWRWDLATVVVDTAGSNSLVGNDAAAVDVDESTAATLRDELDERLRASLATRRDRQRAEATERRPADADESVGRAADEGAGPVADDDDGRNRDLDGDEAVEGSDPDADGEGEHGTSDDRRNKPGDDSENEVDGDTDGVGFGADSSN